MPRKKESDAEFALRLMHAHMGGKRKPWTEEDIARLRNIVACEDEPDALGRAKALSDVHRKMLPEFDLVATYKAEVERADAEFVEYQRVMGPGARQGIAVGVWPTHGDGTVCNDECKVHGPARRKMLEQKEGTL